MDKLMLFLGIVFGYAFLALINLAVFPSLYNGIAVFGSMLMSAFFITIAQKGCNRND